MTSEPLERIVMKNIFRTSALVACFIMLGTAYAAEEEHGNQGDTAMDFDNLEFDDLM